MDQQETSLLATFKNVAAFGSKYAADFPGTSIGAQQFALVTTAVTLASTLGAQQVSGHDAAHTGAMSKASARVLLHDDLLAITTGAHALVLLGTAGVAGKFLLPHNNGDQALLNTASAFATDAIPYTAPLVSVGLPANFLTTLAADIATLQSAIAVKGAGGSAQAGATGGIADATHKAAIALHILKTVVPNVHKNNPVKLAEWVTASHVAKHTPVPAAPPVPPPAP